MPQEDVIIHLKRPATEIAEYRQRLADADMVIDHKGVVIKHRTGVSNRPATADELEQATKVYG